MKSQTLILLLAIGAIGFLAMKRHSFNFGPQPTRFTTEALGNVMTDLKGNTTTLEAVLQQYKGKTIIIDVWASWCGDCLKGLPKVAQMQKTTADKDIVYLFLSVDKDARPWKGAVKRKNIQGVHYLAEGAWKSKLGEFLNLDWIPRYMVVNPAGDISLFKATSADDPAILETALGKKVAAQ